MPQTNYLPLCSGNNNDIQACFIFQCDDRIINNDPNENEPCILASEVGIWRNYLKNYTFGSLGSLTQIDSSPACNKSDLRQIHSKISLSAAQITV